MNTKYYIHIGFGKTGTTSIQFYMNDNRQALARDGIFYPVGQYHQAYHHDLIVNEDYSFLPEDEVRSRWSDLVVKGSKEQYGKVVVSSEFLAARFPDGRIVPESSVNAISHVLEGQDVTVICYLRRHDSLMPSVYGQWLKSGQTTLPPELFAKQCDLSYLPILDLWAKAFGDARIVIVPFERESLSPSLVYSFFDVIDSKILPEYQTPEAKNVSPGGEALKLFISLAKAYNAGEMDQETYHSLRKDLRRIALDLPKKFYNPFTPEEQKAFLDGHSAEYGIIEKRFVSRVASPLFKSPAKVDSSGGKLILSPEVVGGVLGKLWNSSIEQRIKNSGKKGLHFSLLKRLCRLCKI